MRRVSYSTSWHVVVVSPGSSAALTGTARGTVPQAMGPLQLLRHYRQLPEPNPVLASGAADMTHLPDSYSQAHEEPHVW